MTFLMGLAAFGVGFVHSILAPAHWLPVVLLSKSRQWSKRKTLFGAVLASSGHILLSITLGWIAIYLGHELISQYEERVERWAGLGLIVFGLIYAVYSYSQHRRCHGHAHHGPHPRNSTFAPYIFLFSIGFSPCVAVLPLMIAASAHGSLSIVGTAVGFALGVISAFIAATWLGYLGSRRLDHPILEHHGDSLSGLTVVLLGVVFFFVSHSHG